MAKEKKVIPALVTEDDRKEEVVEETQDVVEEVETQEASEPQEVVEEAVDDTLQEVGGETPRERALRLEVTRLKAQRRQARSLDLVKGEDVGDELVSVSKAEAIVLNAFQQDAFDEFLEKYPEYNNNDEAWDMFMEEFSDRIPVTTLAKRKGVPVTKKFIREHLEKIHGSLGLDMSSAMEDGKRDLLKSQAAARIAGSASVNGEVASGTAQPVKRSLFKQTSNSLASWASKK